MSLSSLAVLTKLAGLALPTADSVSIEGADPQFPCRYRVVAPGSAAMAAAGLAAAELWYLRTGRRQHVRLSKYAAAAALRGSRYIRVNNERPTDTWDKITGFYPLKNGRWMYLHCNFFNLRARNLGVLGVAEDRDEVANAVAKWDGLELEAAIVAAGGVGSLVRSEEEWANVPQSKFAASLPLIEISKIGDAPPEPLPAGERPLAGIRVLDLTRVLAGPTCARTLAEHGADVLRLNGKGLADSGISDFDTGLGKLSAYIDLNKAQDVELLKTLIRTGDVFSQSYRPGSLANRGFSPEALAKIRPGIIYTTLNAWGQDGPWQMRRGYDTVVQSANGLAFQGLDKKPQFLPVSAQDYIAGYLLAFGTMVALARRAREGGSWLVRTSLASAGHWIRSHGLLTPAQYNGIAEEFPDDVLRALMTESDSPVGRLTHLKPAVEMSETPPHWARPAVPLGFNEPAWPNR
jgi:crotonobetainyl-CoA:carnitine CoA-transferase CaiB-like acyl-CoA transferase